MSGGYEAGDATLAQRRPGGSREDWRKHMPESDNNTKPRQWEEIEDEVRSAWKAQPESQPVQSNPLVGKEVRVGSKTRLWAVRAAIGVLLLMVIVGAVVLALSGDGTGGTQPAVQLEAGPPMRILPTPPVVGAPVQMPEPTVRPEDYRIFPTPAAGTTTP